MIWGRVRTPTQKQRDILANASPVRFGVAVRVESGYKSRRFQSMGALPALKYDTLPKGEGLNPKSAKLSLGDTTDGSPTALAVGDSHNLSSFSSLVAPLNSGTSPAPFSQQPQSPYNPRF